MTIAITAVGKGCDAEVDLRCERACYILIFNAEGDLVETIDNRRNVYAVHSPTSEVFQLLVRKHVEVILTGPCGARTQQALQRVGIDIIPQPICPVREALGGYMGRHPMLERKGHNAN